MSERFVTNARPTSAGRAVAVDVRDDIRNGREPFSKIMAAVAALQPEEELVLLAPFEPVPLYRVLEKQGFGHSTRPLGAGDWEVRFARQANGKGPLNAHASAPGCPSVSDLVCNSAGVVEVDARGLEPPQPLVKILEAVATLPDTAVLKARTDRRPIHLYAQLEARGFTAETQEQPDGSFLTNVRRR